MVHVLEQPAKAAAELVHAAVGPNMSQCQRRDVQAWYGLREAAEAAAEPPGTFLVGILVSTQAVLHCRTPGQLVRVGPYRLNLISP